MDQAQQLRNVIKSQNQKNIKPCIRLQGLYSLPHIILQEKHRNAMTK